MQQRKFQSYNIPYNAGIKWWEIQNSRVNTLRENMYIKICILSVKTYTQLDTQMLFYKQ